MSDDRLERIEDLLTQLIRNVGDLRNDVSEFRGQATARMEELETKVDELLTSTARIEHRLNIVERRQAKMVDRVDMLEAEVDLLNEDKQ